MLEEYSTFQNCHVVVRFKEIDKSHVGMTAQSIKQGIEILSGYFGEKSFENIQAVIAGDRVEFDNLVINFLGVPIKTPSSPGRLSQPQRFDIVILSPYAYENDSIYKFKPDEYARLMIHELVHVFEEALTPDIETSPLWWSEGLAVYISKQHLFDSDLLIPINNAIKNGDIPTLKEVTCNDNLCYLWGWSVVAFIENNFGKETIIKIVKETRNGNILDFVPDSVLLFENNWRVWISKEGKS